MRTLIIFAAATVIILLGVWATLVLYFDEDRLKEIATEQVRAQTGRELTVSGPLRLSVFPRLSLEAEDVRLSGPPEFDGPDMFEAGRLSLSLRLFPLLRGVVESEALALDRAELRLHTDRSGRSSLDGLVAESGDAPEASRPAIRAERLRLTDVSLVVSDARSGSSERYAIRSLELDRFAFDSPVPFRFSGNLGEPPVFESLEASGTLTVPSGSGPLTLSDLRLDGRLAELEFGLEGMIRLDPGPPLVLELSDGVLDLDGESHGLAFRYQGTARPSVSASLDGGHLDLDRLLERAGGETADAGEDAPQDAAASPLAVFRDMDLDAGLDLESMTLSGLTLTDVTTRLRARNGVLTADPVRGDLDGGRVSATGRVDLNQEPAAVRLSPAFELSDLGRALAPWGLDEWLQGAGDLTLDLNGRGLDVSTLLSSLSGGGSYDFRDGRLIGFSLDDMVDSLRSGDLAAAARGGVGGSTEFRRLSGPVEFRDGQLLLPDIRLETPRLGVGGNVSLGLADLGLDGSIRLSGDRLSRVPMAVSGTLTSPRLSPDVGQAVQEEAGRRILDLLERRGRDDSEEAPEQEAVPEEDDGG